MNVVDTLRGLLRRWYVVVAGLILAILAGAGTYSVVEPGYERTSTQLLVPGEGLVPPGVTNPYLYLGGLTQAADLVVRVMKSSEVLEAGETGTERRDGTDTNTLHEEFATTKLSTCAIFSVTQLKPAGRCALRQTCLTNETGPSPL